MCYLMGEKYVLSETMFVEVDGIYGSDADIVRRARISTAKTKKVFKSDASFLAYFIEHEHTSPFGFPQITLLISSDKMTAEQFARHRTGLVSRMEIDIPVEFEDYDYKSHSFHEQQQFSGRYASYGQEYYLPPVDRLLTQSKGNNQGSSTEVVEGAEKFQKQMKEDQEILDTHYREYLSAGDFL